MTSAGPRCWYCGTGVHCARRLRGAEGHVPGLARRYFQTHSPHTVRTREHQVPRSRGGSDEECNVVIACHACNQSKGALLVDEFRAVLQRRHPQWDGVFSGEAQTPTILPFAPNRDAA